MYEWIKKLPKAELHVHIEGTLEPEQIFLFAERNKISLPYRSVEQLRAAYHFTDLASFLAVYFEGTTVVCTEQDFYDMAWAYLLKAREQGVVHTEIFFDVQTYTARGIPAALVVEGLYAALQDGYTQLGISGYLLLCFLRNLSEAAAHDAFEAVLPMRDKIAGFGLAAQETGNPPIKFEKVFERIRAKGFHVVAHAGEEVGPAYIWQALDVLHAQRIDHGVQAVRDRRLLAHLVERQIPLTVCPLSNHALQVYQRLGGHPLKTLLDAGCAVSLNSDDPAYFGGYIADNYLFAAQRCGLSQAQLMSCARNSMSGSFLDAERKQFLLAQVDEYILE